jgi:hypothetical protein
MEEYKQTIEEVKKVTEADPDTGLSSQEDKKWMNGEKSRD